MNYIAELNAFYDRLELSPLPNAAISLWHAFMSIANKAGWPDRFTVTLPVLKVRSGLSESSLKRARDVLVEKGLLVWNPQGGNLASQYKLISLVKTRYPNELQVEPQSEPKCGLQSELQVEPQIELQSELQSEPQNDLQNEVEPQNGLQIEPQSEPQTGRINKHKLKLKEKETPKGVKKNFVPPTVEEVGEYCLERRNGIDSQRFVDFYAARGWLIGRNRMKDWRAAVRTWERTSRQEGGGLGGSGGNAAADSRGEIEKMWDAANAGREFGGF